MKILDKRATEPTKRYFTLYCRQRRAQSNEAFAARDSRNSWPDERAAVGPAEAKTRPLLMFITADRLPVAFIDQSEISTGLIGISPAAL